MVGFIKKLHKGGYKRCVVEEVNFGEGQSILVNTQVRSDYLIDHIRVKATKQVEELMRQKDQVLKTKLVEINFKIQELERRQGADGAGDEGEGGDRVGKAVAKREAIEAAAGEVAKILSSIGRINSGQGAMDIALASDNTLQKLGEKGATYADSFVVEKGNYNLMKIFQDQAGVPPEITPFTFNIDADSL